MCLIGFIAKIPTFWTQIIYVIFPIIAKPWPLKLQKVQIFELGIFPKFLLQLLSELRRFNQLLITLLITLINLRFSDDFRRNRNYVIHLNLLNNMSEIGRQCITIAKSSKNYLVRLLFWIDCKNVKLKIISEMGWDSEEARSAKN